MSPPTKDLPESTYPADPNSAALRLFLRWFGGYYARSQSVTSFESNGPVATGEVLVGRQWRLAISVANTLTAEADFAFEAGRAAIEQRLDALNRSSMLWVPRGAPLPSLEPSLSKFILALQAAKQLGDGRLEVRRPVELYLRRTSTKGSVITVLGGMAAHWAQFTNRVPGGFMLNSSELFRLPASAEEREALAERIVSAAGQPEVDDTMVIQAEDCWTVNDLDDGGSCVLGSPKVDTDEQNAILRRNLRAALREASPALFRPADAKALVVLGTATYAEDEKLTWALRGMDPSLHAGYDIIAVIADGVVKPLLRPGRGLLPWDAPA